MTVVIWHNPRCSKSRETLALIEARGLTPEIVRYLEAPPSKAALKQAAKTLGVSLRALLRTKEAAYRELGLDNETLSDDAIAEAMRTAPVLIERPIVFSGGKARIGRPPEAVLEIL